MELLAPAGNWDAFLAAIKNGADAVYLGGKKFSARQSAENFDDKQMRKALDFAHFWGRKIYVTVNTLIDNHEMKDALDYLYSLNQMGADGIIIQDIGLIQACRQCLPELKLHGSTQMTIHNADGVTFWKEQGLKRIVLSRECLQEDIMQISNQEKGFELEVFVHGAMCYSYSGQCLFSSMVGGRSGNRGRCAQPCRLAYDIQAQSTGNKCATGEHGKYVLSPADLCLLENLSDLEQAGVNSLKIEGRMKRPEYVAIVTSAYREALDELASPDKVEKRSLEEQKDRLLRIFNRNFSTGYFYNDQIGFLSSNRPNNRGIYAGRVVEQKPSQEMVIKLVSDMNLGDGITVWVGKGKNPSTIVKSMEKENQPVDHATAGELITIPIEGWVATQDRVFKTHDEQLIQEAQASIKDEERFKIAVDVRASLHLGKPVAFTFTDERGHQLTVETRSKAQQAIKHPLDEVIIREKLERMGNTFFYLRSLMVEGDCDLMVPISDLNEARRQATEGLQSIYLKDARSVPLSQESYARRKKAFFASGVKNRKQFNKTQLLLTISVTSLEGAKIALQNGADLVYLGLEGIGSHQRIKPASLEKACEAYDGRIIPLLPRIHKSGDNTDYQSRIEGLSNTVMAGNWGDFRWSMGKGLSVSADYNLNVFNQYALRFLKDLGLESICISPELNFTQLQAFPSFDKVEMLIHGELILMQSQFCMLGEVLGEGGGQKHCGMPCLKDTYSLRDEKHYEFPVATDADCRFYVFNSRTLCMMEDLPKILSLGPSRLRIEGRREKDENIGKIVRSYRQALTLLQHGKKVDLESYRNELEQTAGSAFTKCHYYRGVL